MSTLYCRALYFFRILSAETGETAGIPIRKDGGWNWVDRHRERQGLGAGGARPEH